MPTRLTVASDRPRRPADTFGMRLVMLRRDMGLNQEEVAALCGFTRPTWASWEQGRFPRRLDLVCSQIARATDYDLQWLMLGDAAAPEQHRVG